MNSAGNRTLRTTLAGFGALLLCTVPAVADDPSGKDLAFALQDAFADAIERAEPSLVSVVRIRDSDGLAADSLLNARDDLRQLEMRRLDIRRGTLRDRIQSAQGETYDPNWMPQDFGSGVIIDESGLILTNHHVVERADVLWVILHSGKAVRGELWVADPRSDLAILRVPGGGLKPIAIGDASKMKKGHIVLALGNPLAMARDGRASASWGIIANVERRLPPPPSSSADDMTLHHYGTLFQTDARLNYGTSGGALLNLKGEMIGLVTALAAVRGYDQAAGYAIPFDDTMTRILGVMREGREVEYGFLGILPENLRLTEGEALPPGMPQEGAKVTECFIGSPGYLGGLAKDDIIVSVDNVPVRNREELVLTVGTRFAGNRVPFEVFRSGRRQTLNVTLGKMGVPGQVYAAVRPAPWRGVRVEYLSVLLRNAQTGHRLIEVPDGAVLVSEVQEDSAAARAGVAPNTILTHVGGTRIHWPAEFYEAVKKLRGPIEVVVDGEKITIPE
jgi:S1-C subfamily serine protease